MNEYKNALVLRGRDDRGGFSGVASRIHERLAGAIPILPGFTITVWAHFHGGIPYTAVQINLGDWNMCNLFDVDTPEKRIEAWVITSLQSFGCSAEQR